MSLQKIKVNDQQTTKKPSWYRYIIPYTVWCGTFSDNLLLAILPLFCMMFDHFRTLFNSLKSGKVPFVAYIQNNTVHTL